MTYCSVSQRPINTRGIKTGLRASCVQSNKQEITTAQQDATSKLGTNGLAGLDSIIRECHDRVTRSTPHVAALG